MSRWCKCVSVAVEPSEMWPYLVDEVKEFIDEPSMDELSDVVWSLGRLLGGFVGILYIPLPGMGRHIRKMDERMSKWGCIRSENHPHCC